jgi:hypothetical protein
MCAAGRWVSKIELAKTMCGERSGITSYFKKALELKNMAACPAFSKTTLSRTHA